MKIAVILPAAGLGKRFSEESQQPLSASKIELDLGGQPVFMRALSLFMGRADVGQIILAVNPDAMDEFLFRWGERLRFHGVEVVAGGRKERWETVLKALNAVNNECTHIAIHDAARPLGSIKLIDRIFEAAVRHAAVIPAMPVSATLKRTAAVEVASDDADPLDAILGSVGKPAMIVRQVLATVDRSDLVEVQTPQVFEASLLRRAYAQLADGRLDGAGITDDASLIEALGQPVMAVEGEATNFKITRPGDMELAAALVAARGSKEAVSMASKRLFPTDDE